MNDFRVKDQVMHFREGLAVIEEEKDMNGVNYFLVRILREGGETVYVPVEKADVIIRPIISKKEIGDLIVFVKSVKPEYFNNTKQRRDNFKHRLGSGDIKDLAYLTKQLYFYEKPELVEIPVKFGPADIEMLKYARNTLYDELAIAYKKKRDAIEEIFIKEIF